MNDKLKAAETARKIATSGIAFGAALGIYTLWISRDHITHFGHAIGLGAFEAATLFLLVDFIAVYGKVLTHPRLSAKTRRIGRQGMLAGLGLSLMCNVVSGLIKGGIIPADLSAGGFGAAGYGAFIVGMLVWIERAVSNTKAKAINTAPRERAPQAPPAVQPSGSRKCQPGCTCKRHAARYPVSPGVGPVADYVGPKA